MKTRVIKHTSIIDGKPTKIINHLNRDTDDIERLIEVYRVSIVTDSKDRIAKALYDLNPNMALDIAEIIEQLAQGDNQDHIGQLYMEELKC